MERAETPPTQLQGCSGLGKVCVGLFYGWWQRRGNEGMLRGCQDRPTLFKINKAKT